MEEPDQELAVAAGHFAPISAKQPFSSLSLSRAAVTADAFSPISATQHFSPLSPSQ